MSIQLASGLAIPFHEAGVITKEQLREYAEASGDFNPIHLDEAVAKKAGLPGIIAHGMLIAAFLAKRAEIFMREEAGLSECKLVQLQTRFKAMTFVGDTPSVGGLVKTVSEGEVVLELQAKNQKSEVTTLGTAKFKLP